MLYLFYEKISYNRYNYIETSRTTSQYYRYNLLWQIESILSPTTDTAGKWRDTTASVFNGNQRKQLIRQIQLESMLVPILCLFCFHNKMFVFRRKPNNQDHRLLQLNVRHTKWILLCFYIPLFQSYMISFLPARGLLNIPPLKKLE